VNFRRIVIATAVCLGLVALTAWLLGWSLDKAIVLAPVVVVVAGAAAFLVVLWTKIALESWRQSRRN
jgi:hypothetical protein